MELNINEINDMYLIIYPLSNTFQDMLVISNVILRWLRNDFSWEKTFAQIYLSSPQTGCQAMLHSTKRKLSAKIVF